MIDAKKALRARLRQSVPTGDSGAICQSILRHPWFLEADTVMAYLAMPVEPDLETVVEETLCLGKRLVLPRCETGYQLTAREIGEKAQLVPGVFGILEPPETAKIVSPREIDLILVPGMAFDRAGRRLGRGKGYYDRFLAEYLGKTIGICYQSALVERVPTMDYDRMVDAVITDQMTILCRTEEDRP